MLRPLDLAGRLSMLLEAMQATFVDMSDIQSQRRALNTCRAPALGWREYLKGKKYDPPTKSHDKEHFYGPKDGTGWTQDGDGNPIRIPSNPHSAKFGGVRPWSPEEIIVAMMDEAKTTGMFPYGIRSMINRFKAHAQAAKPGIEFDAEEYIPPALDQLWMAIEKDQGKVGTEFTKYLALHMDLSGGAPAGHHNEHRMCRGILTKWDKLLNRIADAVETGEYDPEALLATVGELGTLGTAKNPKKGQVKDARPTKSDTDDALAYHENPFGLYGGRMEQLYKHLGDLLVAGDAEGIRAMRPAIKDLYDDVEEDEARYSGEGMAHGKLGSQPRDLPAIGTSAHRFESVKYVITVVDPDPERMNIRLKDPSEDEMVLRRDPETGAPRVRHFCDLMAKTEGRALSAARDAYAKKYKFSPKLVALLPFTANTTEEDVGAGFAGVSSTAMQVGHGKDAEWQEHPGLSQLEHDVTDSEEYKAEMTELLSSLRYGSGKQKIGQAHRALDVVKSLFSVIEQTLNPKPRPNLDVRPDTRGDFSPDEAAGRQARAGGYNVIDVDREQIIARVDSEAEAAEYLARINNPVMTSLKYASSMMTRPKLGDEYYDELFELAQGVVQAVRTQNEEALAEIAKELEMTKTILEEDIAAGPEEHAPLLSDREYRIAIRKLGLSDYPEKGTVNDPEIDENGRLSKWAQAGYPIIQKDIGRGKGELEGTLYAPGEEGAGEVMLDKHIAQDIGVSPQSIGTIWRKVEVKLNKLAQQLYEHHVWANDLDAVDLQVLRETCNRIAVSTIEGLRRAARLALLLE